MSESTTSGPTASARDLVRLRERQQQMVEDLARLTRCESPSGDPDATRRCGSLVEGWLDDLAGVGRAERCEVEGVTHLRWRFGPATKVLLVAHLDTVWPTGTLQRWPFHVSDGLATGPGVFDMKAGLVQMGHALSVLDDLDGVAIVVTADEELGSPTSRALIEDTARGAAAALVLEPSADGRLKTGRKGGSLYRLEVVGRAAHAGLEPERGANATVALAAAVTRMVELADPGRGTTVTPTVVRSGTTANTVPASAVLHVDVRASDADEQVRVDEALRSLAPVVDGTSFLLHGGINRPPLTEARSGALFARAARHAVELGMPELGSAAVGGGSDGNFTAAIGIPTLDGLGAVGAGAHAEGEHVVIDQMPVRAALVARLVQDLCADVVRHDDGTRPTPAASPMSAG
jgi:glutamate carboxypeptidase